MVEANDAPAEAPKHPPLTKKRRLFVQEYVISGNAKQAAIKAGYSKRSASCIGYELLHKYPQITEAIEQIRGSMGAEAAALCATEGQEAITPAWVMKTLVEVVQRCMEAKPVYSRKGVLTDKWQFDQAGANAALDKIAKILRMYDDDKKDGATVTVNISFGATESKMRVIPMHEVEEENTEEIWA